MVYKNAIFVLLYSKGLPMINNFKFLIDTLKEGKWLILRYVFVAIYLLVSGIIANKLEIVALTYYNAVITIVSFADMIGYGIANGVGIFINQNYDNSEKINNYTKVGLYAVMGILLFVCILLAVFNNFVLEQLFNLPSTIDKAFYFMMLGYMFLNGIKEYLGNILKKLEEYKATLNNSIFTCSIIVIGFLLAYFVGNMSLYFIGGVYFAYCIAVLIYTQIVLLKNKVAKINLFAVKSVRLNSKEGAIISQILGIEALSQIGIIFISLYLANVSHIIFDQYSYYKNIIFIFDGIYYAFTTVISIRICKYLGQNEFDSAYKNGKQSLWGVLLIWAFSFVVLLSLAYPLVLLMNEDIREGAYAGFILYGVLNLIRYVVWHLDSSILYNGGRAKILLGFEIMSTLMYILLFLLLAYIRNNVFLIYFLIALPELIKLPFFLYMFKNKKWIKRLNDN